jgi:hypothetical protein
MFDLSMSSHRKLRGDDRSFKTSTARQAQLQPQAQPQPQSQGRTVQFDLRKVRDQWLSDLSVLVEHYMRSPTFLAALRLSMVLSTQKQTLSKWRPFASFRLQRVRT